MRVRQLEIENFRGITVGRVLFQQHTLLVGGNNIGKSTVCEALELVLGPVGERVVFDKLIDLLRWGIPYKEVADATCSATTISRRRDEWIQAGIFEDLEHLCLKAADKMLGLELDNLTVDGCIVKARW